MQNHTWKGFAAGALCGALALGLGTGAMASAVRTLEATFGIQVTLDGAALDPRDAAGNAVEAFAVDGTTYLPVRAVAGAAGLEVAWDQDQQTVRLTTPGKAPLPDSGYDRESPAPVGTAQTFLYTTGGTDYKLEMSVTEVTRGADAWTALKAVNQFNKEAPTGKEYLLVKVSAKVVESGGGAVSLNAARFDLFSAGGVEYTDFWTAVPPSPKFDGRVFEGGKLEGDLAFLVDADDDAPRAVFGADYKGQGGAWFSLSE